MKTDKILGQFFGLVNSNFVKIADWALAFGFIAFAVYLFLFSSEEPGFLAYAMIILGVIGLATAYKRPSEMLEKGIKKKVIKK